MNPLETVRRANAAHRAEQQRRRARPRQPSVFWAIVAAAILVWVLYNVAHALGGA